MNQARSLPESIEATASIEGIIQFDSINTAVLETNDKSVFYNRIVSKDKIVHLTLENKDFYLIKTKNNDNALLIGVIKENMEGKTMTDYFLDSYDLMETAGEEGNVLWLPCFKKEFREETKSPVFQEEIVRMETEKGERAVNKAENSLFASLGKDFNASQGVIFPRKEGEIKIEGSFVVALINATMLETTGIPCHLAFSVEERDFIQA